MATQGPHSGEIAGVPGQPATAGGATGEEEDVWQLAVRLAGLPAEVPARLQAGSLWEHFQAQFSQVYLVRMSVWS